MKKKQIMALALVIAMSAGAAGTVSLNAMAAADFTQAKTPAQVTYGTLTESQLAIVNACFDAEFYAAKYDDVVEALGTDSEMLLKHFVMCGIFEGRKGWADFDPSAYASAYSDLKDKFGNDIPKYYSHYYNQGKAEGRNLTTIEACEAAGIKVVSFFDESALLPVDVYAASNLMGTTDYNTTSKALQAAVSNGAATVTNGDDTFVIVPTEKIEETPAEETPAEEQPAEETPAEEQPAEETPAEEQPVAEDIHFEVKGTITLKTEKDGQVECAILLLKNETGLETRIFYSENEALPTIIKEADNIVGIVPIVIYTSDAANAKIEEWQEKDIEEFSIETFDVSEGNIIGTQGIDSVDLGMQYDNYYSATYLTGDDVETNGQTMKNYVQGQTKENATVGFDAEGSEESEYTISTYTEMGEDGVAKLTTQVKSDDGYAYETTYKFQDDEFITFSDDTTKGYMDAMRQYVSAE